MTNHNFETRGDAILTDLGNGIYRYTRPIGTRPLIAVHGLPFMWSNKDREANHIREAATAKSCFWGTVDTAYANVWVTFENNCDRLILVEPRGLTLDRDGVVQLIFGAYGNSLGVQAEKAAYQGATVGVLGMTRTHVPVIVPIPLEVGDQILRARGACSHEQQRYIIGLVTEKHYVVRPLHERGYLFGDRIQIPISACPIGVVPISVLGEMPEPTTNGRPGPQVWCLNDEDI